MYITVKVKFLAHISRLQGTKKHLLFLFQHNYSLMTWDDLTCALKCAFVCDEIFLRHTFILTLFTKLGCLDMVMLNAYIVLETVNLNTMYLKNVNGFVDMWGVFSMKLSSQFSRFIHHQIICVSHQARDIVRYMSSFVTIFGTILQF